MGQKTQEAGYSEHRGPERLWETDQAFRGPERLWEIDQAFKGQGHRFLLRPGKTFLGLPSLEGIHHFF